MSLSKLFVVVPQRILTMAVLALAMASLPSLAQKSKERLEQDKKDNLKKIEEAKSILAQTETKRNYTVGQLRAINQQIKIRQDLIRSITEEVVLLVREIAELNSIVESLTGDLEKLKREYSSMIIASYKASRGYDRLVFLFSAKSFNQFLMRIEYLEQYSMARQNQVKQIEMVKESLESQRLDVKQKKEKRNDLLASQIQENRNLISLKDKQNDLVIQLGKKEKELRQELENRRQANIQLDRLIADLVRAEIERRKRSEATGDRTLSAEAAALSSEFAKNRNKLPWPVETGFISSKFGKQPHPVLKGIMIENPGVDIQTKEGQPVQSVFSGEVSTIAFVPGMNNVVLLKHGEFFTLYAGLNKVDVKKGQAVQINDVLGKVYTDGDGISELQFQVWQNSLKLNPEQWLIQR